MSKKKPEAGEGWRLLGLGDVLQNGDEAWVGGTQWEMMPYDFGPVVEWLKDDPDAVFRRKTVESETKLEAKVDARTVADVVADAETVKEAMRTNAHGGKAALHRLVAGAARVPELVAEVRRLREENEELRAGESILRLGE
jgi:hypothetical protein